MSRRASRTRCPRPAIRSPPRSVIRRRSSTSSTSSRKIAPTIRSSATSRKATASRIICLFPEAITPNHHALVREFVLLDNFYVDGEVSADGHEWSMGAYASDFVERIWPLGYRGDRRVPYPSEGTLDEVARPAGGYIWDKAADEGRELSQLRRVRRQWQDARRSRHGDGQEPGGPHSIRCSAASTWTTPTVKRAERFLEELAGFEKKGEMPGWCILRLPNDHTSGTRPGKWTVTACVADNDLALGRMVEGLSKSRFWKEMAIFVIEDDAQNGSDHVDAHRTVALAISPYIKRHAVDSTMYSTSSMLRTMELILGLEPMTQFDAAARPMFNAFTSQPDFSPYL